MKAIQTFVMVMVLFAIGCGSASEDQAKNDTVSQFQGESSDEVSAPGGTGRSRQLAYQLVAAPSSPASESSVSSLARMIIKTAGIECEVEDYDKTVVEVQRVTEAAGGYVVSSSVHNQDARAKAGEIVVRVPSERFDATLQTLKGLARTMEAEYVQGNDITEEFYDLSARLDNKRKAEQRFLEILKTAKTSREILEVEQALMGVREEIERMEGRKRFLADQTALSTITIRMHEPRPLVNTGSENFWSRLQRGIGRGLERGMDGFVGIVSASIAFLIAAIPFLIGCVVAVWGGRKLYRRARPAQDE